MEYFFETYYIKMILPGRDIIMSRMVHFEIPADDPERAILFYENVFNWKIDKWDQYEYWLIKTGEDNEPGINGAFITK